MEPNNPLAGKFLALNGDSICAGSGYRGGYGKIIAEDNGMSLQNLAVGGATVSAENYYKNGGRHHWICRTVECMNPDADYAILEGGVNDVALGVPLGQITEGYSEPLDDTTFCGAFESMLKQLLIRFAGKKYGYIAVHKMTDGYNSVKAAEGNYYHAAKQCCEKWAVPFLDLNISVPPFAYFAEDGDPLLYALRKQYTKKGDGWHPNEACYRQYYVPKIEAWLKTL